MTLDPQRVETIMYDSFSTLVDVHSGEDLLADYVAEPARVSRLWRNYVWRYRPFCNFVGYVSHHEINRSALEYVFESLDVEATSEEIDEIARIYYEMDPFEDVYPAMTRLDEADFDQYVLSNGNQDVIDAMVANVGIEALLADTISADEIKTYKPHVRLYKHAARRARTPASNAVMVSAAWEDVLGGVNAGMQGIWVNRENDPRGLEPFDCAPDAVVDSFTELGELLVP